MGPAPFTAERRADGREGTVNGDRDHKQAMALRCVIRKKMALCTEDSKSWRKERDGKEVETRDPRP